MNPVKGFFASIIIVIVLLLLVQNSYAQTFIHPGILHTEADFDRMRTKVNAKQEPWKSGWDRLTSNPHAHLSYFPRPVEIVYRGTGSPENYAILFNDAAAAYQCALRWKISNDKDYADKAVEILNAWAKTCKLISGTSDAALCVGLQGFALANAAEIMRSYKGWSATDFAKVQAFMLTVFYTPASDFLSRRNGACPTHYWANWGLCNASTVMAIGILCDNVSIYNEGIYYMKKGNYTEAIPNVVYHLFSPTLGQWQESNRDQGHSLMGVGLAADICEMAWNQGDNLYAYDNNRLLAGFEYVAKYNLGEEVPNIPYDNCEHANQLVIGEKGRGSERPIWEKIYNHYTNRIGIKLPYSEKFAAKLRPEGGGGNYGPNSGGFDVLGFGTLTKTLDPLDTACLPTYIAPAIQVNNNTLLNETANLTINTNDKITLIPHAAGSGTWSWSNGATSSKLVLNKINKSAIYRVVYTNACGAKMTQSFSIAVKEDCIGATILPFIKVNSDGWKLTNSITVKKGDNVKLGPQPKTGTWSWSDGETAKEVVLKNLQADTKITATNTSPCGKQVSIDFIIKVN